VINVRTLGHTSRHAGGRSGVRRQQGFPTHCAGSEIDLTQVARVRKGGIQARSGGLERQRGILQL